MLFNKLEFTRNDTALSCLFFFFCVCRSETKYTDLVKESQIVVQTEDINDKD